MKRNPKIDFIRAFAIITVVIGHSIQYGSGSTYNYFEDYIFKFIYSFHMPLFMLISGYLFYQTVNRHNFLANMISRCTSLLIPIIMWNTVNFIVYIYEKGAGEPHTFRYILRAYWFAILENSWFLWALFYCSFVVLIVNCFFNDNVIVYLIGLILTFITPDSYYLFLYKFMYPYFIIGYFYHKHSDNVKEKSHTSFESWRLLGAFMVIFIILLYFYNINSYIYTTRYTLIGKEIMSQLVVDVYRFAIGLFGSVFMILLLLKIYKISSDNVIEAFSIVGTNSLGIYMISGFIYGYVLPCLTVEFSTVNYAMVMLESIVILVLSLLISLCLKKINCINLLFLGGRK